MSIHKDHRQRMRKRFEEEGLDHFSDIQVLEFLLFYAIPRQDTNPIAHALLERFGSLPQVLEAPVEELEKVPGVGHHSAQLLSLIPALTRYYHRKSAEQGLRMRTVSACCNYLKQQFIGRRTEVVYLMCLDAKCKMLSCQEVGEGSVNSANVSVRRIVELALRANATSVILAHNHPSGLASPSGEDIQTTYQVASALSAVDVQLVDHIIVADDDYVSLAQSGYRFDEKMVN